MKFSKLKILLASDNETLFVLLPRKLALFQFVCSAGLKQQKVGGRLKPTLGDGLIMLCHAAGLSMICLCSLGGD